jgi:hypothetical protein
MFRSAFVPGQGPGGGADRRQLGAGQATWMMVLP